ncbi:undecaprenyl-diphosphate phosphatase [Acidicapsa acidisoli]|uniref:undecaprenyl-diphosphate phosphatase n=1 Tax=Acidicapsa acidisoli TaxID=1615681 RepID=UPI0021DFB59B|nr:undecaprenyl-diphosphate phosphatase [Acidicapsa acidisoli]
MNSYLMSVLLGIVEGLTEFLPVSSTAHLRIAEALLHIDLTDAYWKMYTIVIQLGAIVALCLLFMGRIIEFVRTFPAGENGNRTIWNHPISLTLIAFACTSVPALLLKKLISKNLESLQLMAFALLIGGVVMWIIDAWTVRHEAGTVDVEEMNLVQAIFVGLCQTLSAVFPGTSRSMSTIASGQLVGLTRSTALEFSFLLSIPTMIAATGWDLYKEVLHPSAAEAAELVKPLVMNTERWIVLVIGLFVSFIVALGVVEWFLQWVRRHGLVLFAVYRIVLAMILLTLGKRFLNMQ